jgi:hypothetical protein
LVLRMLFTYHLELLKHKRLLGGSVTAIGMCVSVKAISLCITAVHDSMNDDLNHVRAAIYIFSQILSRRRTT